jgi:hypothetical protein
MNTEGSRPYGDRDKQAFANTFDRLLTRLLKRAQTDSESESVDGA